MTFGLLAAIGGGLLVGIERERHKGTGPRREPAGVRSFTVVALVGAVSAILGPVAIGVGGAAVGAMAVVAHRQNAAHDPGLTTELALLATFFLGAVSLDQPQLGAALFVALGVLLQSKDALHHFTRRVLTERELDDALLLAASVLIVLPLLPDRTIDPLAVLNPRKLWLFAVMVMAINAAGYVALRALGGRRGLLLAGFFGGFVSSSATIASMGHRAAESPGLRRNCVAAALFSCIATVIEIGLILAVIAPALLRDVGPALVAAGAVAVVTALAVVGRDHARPADRHEMVAGRPFAIRHAILFAGIVAVALLLSKILQAQVGGNGALAAAAATGLADVHAAAVSLAELVATAGLSIPDGARALAAAFTTNSIVKAFAATTGGAAYASAVVVGVALVNLALVLTLVWR